MGKLYDTKKWKDLRKRKLDDNPTCEVCNRWMNLEVDHICDHNNNEDLFFDIDNLQTLCHNDHSKKTLLDVQMKQKESNKEITHLYFDPIVDKDVDMYLSFLKDFESTVDKYISYYLKDNKIYFWSQNKRLTYYFIRKLLFITNKNTIKLHVNDKLDKNYLQWIISLLSNLKVNYEVVHG